MAKFELKAKVQALRKQGMSLKQIMREVDISKSTASLWCREIVLTEAQRRVLKKKMIEGGHAGRLKGA
jgi:orotate phosphoribosyltransferase-like protein